MKLRGVDLSELVEALAEVIDRYTEEHPGTSADEIEAAVSYVHGAMFRLANETPPSKLH